MKKSITATLLVSCLVFCSCSYIWTYKFMPSERYEQPDLKGWVLTPNIKKTIRVGRGEDSLLANQQRFIFDLSFELPKKREVENLYDIDVEGTSIKFFDLDTEKTLRVSASFFYGAIYNEMSKKFSLVPMIPQFNTTIGKRSVFIPLEVDSALLTFDALLTRGRYTTFPKENSSLRDDTIIVLDNAESIRVPMSIVLHKKATKEGAIGLVPGH